MLQPRHLNRSSVRLSVRHWSLSMAETVCLGCLTIPPGNLRIYDVLKSSAHFRRGICDHHTTDPSDRPSVRPAVNIDTSVRPALRDAQVSSPWTSYSAVDDDLDDSNRSSTSSATNIDDLEKSGHLDVSLSLRAQKQRI